MSVEPGWTAQLDAADATEAGAGVAGALGSALAVGATGAEVGATAVAAEAGAA